ncbi:CPBP family intramembrane glutamic endopeptidase [Tissierella praeacuta]|uniref:CPBP family intramembrane glutamic endopeptidase n=1 Tax=Tissierella praeacuta TaxID=43131 RepID=UPI0028A00931|nr:CPBP family intramembrane glutamic endopeptidase [Tissierella praeacuta]
MENKKQLSVIMLIFLYILILILPFLIYSDNIIFSFLEQPLLIFIPTILISRIYIKRTGTTIKEFYRLRKVSTKNMLLITIIVFLLPLITNVVADISCLFFNSDLQDDIIFKPEMYNGLAWATGVFFYNIFFTSIFPAICEETLFRGSILRFTEVFGWKSYIIILLNALLFGIFHQNMEQLFYTFLLGIIFTNIVLVTDSILAGIYVHFAYNFIIDLSSVFDLSKHKLISQVARIIDSMNHIIYSIIAVILIFIIIKYMDRGNRE